MTQKRTKLDVCAPQLNNRYIATTANLVICHQKLRQQPYIATILGVRGSDHLLHLQSCMGYAFHMCLSNTALPSWLTNSLKPLAMLSRAESLSESKLVCPLSHAKLCQPKTAICFASDDAASSTRFQPITILKLARHAYNEDCS
jgi:hypothetical protein